VQVEQRVAQHAHEVEAEAWAAVEVLYSATALPEPELAPGLRWVQAHFAGVNRWMGHPLLERVILTNSSGVHATTMAEHVLMFMLALARRLPAMLRAQTEHTWVRDHEVRELRGGALAVVGYGSIGREVARLARALGMRVLASKRDPRQTADQGWRLPGTGDPAGELVERFYGPEDWQAMLPEADYVVVAAPLAQGTRHLIDRKALSAMRPGAVLINVARGDVVDEAALVEALRAGAIGGAGLDVFAEEPLPAGSPLWDLPQVIVSPHVSGNFPAYDEHAMRLFAENLRRYLAGEPLLNVVDPALGY
jgi:phosphoglycerate dehydrogenase-like enzyme